MRFIKIILAIASFLIPLMVYAHFYVTGDVQARVR